MAAPTTQEQRLLEMFRTNIRDLNLEEWQTEDMFLLSWIRARDLDLAKAEDMLRKSLIWRQKEDIANIFSWQPPEHYFQMFQCYISGNDYEGRPVVYLPLGSWDIKKVVDQGERATYVRFADQMVAGFIKAVRESNHTQFLIILDMTGLALRQFTYPSTVDTILETFRRFEANYPETLFLAFIINAPKIFPLAFSLVKPLLSQRTKNKIQIFNSNASKWRPILEVKIPPQSFPKVLEKSDYEKGGESNNPNLTSDDLGNLVERRIDAGGKLDIHVNVTSLNSILRWEFQTDNYDINFEILHGTTQLCSSKRYNSHVEKVEGSILCENVGKHTLTFDNTYSRFRSKTVRYRCSIYTEE